MLGWRRKKLGSQDEKLLLQVSLSVWQYTAVQDSKVQFLYSLSTKGSILTSHLVKSPFQVPPILSTTNVFTLIPFLSNFSLTSYSIPILWLSTLCLGMTNSFSQSSSESKVSKVISSSGSVILATFPPLVCLQLVLASPASRKDIALFCVHHVSTEMEFSISWISGNFQKHLMEIQQVSL